jgi:cytochrome c-type biogenesis protein
LAAYSAGLAIPFLVSALALDRFQTLFGRFKRLLPVVSTVGGIFLILVGALLVTNYFTLLSTIGIRLTPRWLVERL